MYNTQGQRERERERGRNFGKLHVKQACLNVATRLMSSLPPASDEIKGNRAPRATPFRRKIDMQIDAQILVILTTHPALQPLQPLQPLHRTSVHPYVSSIFYSRSSLPLLRSLLRPLLRPRFFVSSSLETCFPSKQRAPCTSSFSLSSCLRRAFRPFNDDRSSAFGVRLRRSPPTSPARRETRTRRRRGEGTG